MSKQSTFLTIMKIMVCCIIFFLTPFFVNTISILTKSNTIAYTFVINSIAFFYVLFNHQLVFLHFRRFLNDIKENVIYIFLTTIICLILHQVAVHSLNLPLLSASVEPEIMTKYSFFIPVIVISYSISTAFNFNVCYKLFTDKFSFKSEPILIIIVSSVLFGAFASASVFLFDGYSLDPFDYLSLLRLLGFYIPLSMCTSYSYNQTRSIVPMMCGYSLSLIVFTFIL